MMENPYAPPEAEIEILKYEVRAEDFWVKDGALFVKDGKVLPDVCLLTGEVVGDFVRKEESLSCRPLWAIIGMVVSIGLLLFFANLFFLVLILIFGFLDMKLCASARLVYCVTTNINRISVMVRQVFWVVSVLFGVIVAIISGDEGVPNLLNSLVFGLIGALVFRALLGVIYRRVDQFRLQGMRHGVGEYRKVSPIALKRLERWRLAHLKGAETELGA